MLLDPMGNLCRPNTKEGFDFPQGLFGAGVARVDGGLVVCGGRRRGPSTELHNRVRAVFCGTHGTEKKKMSLLSQCYLWEFNQRSYRLMPGSDLKLEVPAGADQKPDGTILMTNAFLEPLVRNELYVFVQHTGQFLTGTYSTRDRMVQSQFFVLCSMYLRSVRMIFQADSALNKRCE